MQKGINFILKISVEIPTDTRYKYISDVSQTLAVYRVKKYRQEPRISVTTIM